MSLPYNASPPDEVNHVEPGCAVVIALRQILPLCSETLAACREHGSHRVIIEGHRPRRDMEFDGVSRHGDFLQELDRPGLRVAFCLYDSAPDDLSEQFMCVAHAGSTCMAFCEVRPAALAWLRAACVPDALGNHRRPGATR